MKPKHQKFINALVATNCPAIADSNDLIEAAHHGGWTCIPAWVRTDSNRKVGRGQWDVSDLLALGNGGAESATSCVGTEQDAPEKAPAPAPVTAAPTATVAPTAVPTLALTGGERTSLVPSKISTYVPWGHFGDVEQIIGSKMFYPIFITGLSGNGKTTMVDQVCAKLKRPCYRINITAQTDEDDLLGGFRLINGDTVWQDGPVVAAMEDPNGGVLLLDEIDLGTAAIMCLQSVLEGKGVFLKKVNRWVTPQPGFTVVATANTKGKGDEQGRFAGTNIMNEAMLDRFPVTLEQEYAPKTTEKKILTKVMKSLGDVDKSFCDLLVSWSDMIRKCYFEDAVDEIITTRRLVNVATSYAIFGDRKKAIEMAVARFDDATKEAFVSMYDKLDGETVMVADEETVDADTASRFDLQCGYDEKDEAKRMGAKWDKVSRKWYVDGDRYRQDTEKWAKWSPVAVADIDTDAKCPF